MAHRKLTTHWFLALSLCSALCCALLPAQAQVADLAVRMVAGRAYLLVDLMHGRHSVPAHLLLDFGATQDLVLHNRTAQLLELGEGDAVGISVRGERLCAPVPLVQGVRALEELTRDYAEELRETPVVGILGASAFGTRRLTLDLRRNLLSIGPGGVSRASDAVEQLPDGLARLGQKFELPWAGTGTPRFVVRATARDGRTVEAMCGLTPMDHDVRVSDVLLRQLGAPGGDVASLALGPFELTRHAALRPESAAMPWEDAPPVVIGNAFLSCFIVSMDPVRRVTAFECVAEPVDFAADAECFAAMAVRDLARLREWLEANEDHRLRRDAADAHFALTIVNAPEDGEAVLKALRLLAEAISPKRRARLVLDVVAALKDKAPATHALVVRKALELALGFAGEDEDADAVHKVRSEIGAQLLEAGDLEGAWRHLLAASMGMPRDGVLNERLGTLYERMNKPERAWSRFLQAAITADGGPGGLAGIERLRKKSGVEQPFKVDELERMLEGRAPLFEPASVHRAVAGAPLPTRRVLVELFTGVHCKPCAAADLGFEGLMHHFAGAEVTLVQHHLHVPRPDPLTTNAGLQRARECEVAGTPTLLLDGAVPVDGGGLKDDAGKVFRALQSAVESRLQLATPWSLKLVPVLRDGQLQVEAEVTGPAEGKAHLTLLCCQRSMLMPGLSGIVFQRYVNRGELVDGGVQLSLVAGRATTSVAAKLSEIDAECDDHQDEVEAQTGTPFPMRAARIDPEQIVVVGWITSGAAVVQSASVELHPREVGKKR